MTKYFCDRCETQCLLKPEEILMSKSFTQCNVSDDKALCDSCISQLIYWLKPLPNKLNKV